MEASMLIIRWLRVESNIGKTQFRDLVGAGFYI